MTPIKEHIEKQRAIWQITSSYSFESATLSPHLSQDRLFEFFDIEGFLSLFGIEGRSRESMIEFLTHKGLILPNMQGGFEVKTLLGICCARDMNKFPELRHKAPRVIVYKGTNNQDAADDTEGVRGYAIGFKPLYDFIIGKIPSK